ncbi:MAG TPA: hypothetical protein VK787_13015 [Puia sp.]|nr:hypothetical protein [Puia sp.]
MADDHIPNWVKGIKDTFQTPLTLFSLLAIFSGIILIKILPIKKDENPIIAYWMISIFSFLLLAVFIITLIKPENLIYDKEARLRDKGKPPFGTSDHPTQKPSSKRNVKPNE